LRVQSTLGAQACEPVKDPAKWREVLPGLCSTGRVGLPVVSCWLAALAEESKSGHGRMKGLIILGVILILLGIALLSYQLSVYKPGYEPVHTIAQ
jgi:hypothetical protein